MSAPTSSPTSSGDRAVVLELARTGRTVTAPAGTSLLTAVREVVDVPSTCTRGECGSCVSTLLDGEADYRNAVLSARARQAGRRIALCVDRARTDRLVLDL